MCGDFYASTRIGFARKQCPQQIGLRVNPGIGAGHNNRLMTGGANSSFGLWNAYVPEALQLANKNGVKIDRLHVHIGSGADPKMWGKILETALGIAEIMPDVTSLDLGGVSKYIATAMNMKLIWKLSQLKLAITCRYLLIKRVENCRWSLSRAPGWLVMPEFCRQK
ncbi:hypothetical protein IPL68_05040 [Candidatus Saccharibacteria bacterium]|nr:MAG: hypothetical protein IPL68_05040 [Candidatus Saccharibacteria bacterium]